MKIHEDQSFTDASAEDVRQFARHVADEAVKQVGERIARDAPRVRVGESRERSGFQSFSHFCHDVYKAGPDHRGASETLQQYLGKAPSGMGEVGGAEGGYLVPEEFATQLLTQALENAIVRPRATAVPMATNAINLPAIGDTDHGSNLFGGITVYRAGEGEQVAASNPELSNVSLKLGKVTGLCYVSDELIEDSPISMEPVLHRLFAAAIAFTEDADFLAGDGVGKPEGVLNADALIAVDKESGQSADTITWNNVKAMWARLHPACKKNAVWVASPDTAPQLMAMSQSVGTTGGVAVYLPGNMAAEAPFTTLMGRPVIESEKVPVLGEKGDIGLYDFSQYLVGHRSGPLVRMATSLHVRFDYGETAFRFTLRNDGRSWWKAPLTPRNGGATLSPFVTLEARG